MIGKTIEDTWRIRMFKLFYKELSDLPVNERFVTAIVRSSEEHLPITPEREPLILKWYQEFVARRKKEE